MWHLLQAGHRQVGQGILSSYSNFLHPNAPSGKQAKKLDNFSLLTYIPTKGHAWSQNDSAILKHFHKCEGWKHITGFLGLDEESIDVRELQINNVRQNIQVIKRADHWQTLAFKESLAIKDRKPSLNNGVKAAKYLCLF